MQVYIGSDHAGYQLKEVIQDHLKDSGHEVVDLGVFTDVNKVDYPDIAREVGEKVNENKGSLGILACGSGIGVCIAANKVKGIRAANVHDVTTAKYARLHNNANVMTLGERMVGTEVAKDIVDAFLGAEFEGGRHEKRVGKITKMESD